ncbi:unnamed protein product [Dibothriocephalus latus]|uniref:Uncharacterized protein n=1 Tax=Dibothriocephalus latus TaxID=60516 RepID=A0A3P7NVD9_DIBLA|nr:unnamed protein product [Dibothriocephalus latus]
MVSSLHSLSLAPGRQAFHQQVLSDTSTGSLDRLLQQHHDKLSRPSGREAIIPGKTHHLLHRLENFAHSFYYISHAAASANCELNRIGAAPGCIDSGDNYPGSDCFSPSLASAKRVRKIT